MTEAELEQFVVAVMQRLDVLGEQVASLIGPPPAAGRLSPTDCERAAVLLPAISAAIGDETFVSKDLIIEADRDPELASAIVTATGALDATTTQRLGKFLRRVDGHTVSGLALRRSSGLGEKSRDGVMWRVNVTMIVTERRTVTSAVASSS